MRSQGKRLTSSAVAALAALMAFGTATAAVESVEQLQDRLKALDSKIATLREAAKNTSEVKNAQARADAAASDAEKVKADPSSTPAARMAALNNAGRLKRECDQAVAKAEKSNPELAKAIADRDLITKSLSAAVVATEKAEADRKAAAAKAEETRQIQAAAASRLEALPAYRASRTWQLEGDIRQAETVPLDGTETPMSVVVQKGRDFTEQPATVCVAVRATEIVDQSYAVGQQHYGFELRQLDRSGRTAPPTCTAHLLRRFGDELLGVINAAGIRNVNASVPMRLKLLVTRAPLVERPIFEIVDWQFLNADGKAWGPWFSAVDWIGIDYAVRYETNAREHRELKSFMLSEKIRMAREGFGDGEYFRKQEEDAAAKHAAKQEQTMREWVKFRKENGLEAVEAATRPAA